MIGCWASVLANAFPRSLFVELFPRIFLSFTLGPSSWWLLASPLHTRLVHSLLRILGLEQGSFENRTMVVTQSWSGNDPHKTRLEDAEHLLSHYPQLISHSGKTTSGKCKVCHWLHLQAWWVVNTTFSTYAWQMKLFYLTLPCSYGTLLWPFSG